MDFFFVQDYRKKYRCISAEPIHNIQINFTRLQKIWIEARKRFMLLPKRILAQEQAFERVLKSQGESIRIFHSGRFEEKRIRRKFFLFLQKQRTKHILFLIGECILLPLSGLLALLPGPNIFFGVLALVTFTHWQALRGISRLSRKSYEFVSDEDLKIWENALESGPERDYPIILEKMKQKFGIENLHKILYRRKAPF